MTTDHLIPATAAAASTPPTRDAAGSLATLGAITGLGAIAGSSCCVLPLALAGLGAGSAAFGGLEFLAAYQPYIFGAAALLLAGAWFAFWRRSRALACKAEGACARSKTQDRTMIALGIATLLVGMAAGWGFVEPVLLQAVQ